MRFKPGEIESLTGATMVSRGSAGLFARIAIDSRECSKDTLFVALRGERTDGHNFLTDAWKRGAAGALVEKDGCFLPDFTVFRVTDTENTLKNLGKACTGLLQGTRLAFTGTVGKTTAKRFFQELLSSRFQVEATPRSFNTVIGMAVSLCNFSVTSSYYLLEAGINHPGEMAELSSLAQAEIAIFTPFGEGHLEGLRDVETVAREKMRLVCGKTRRVYLYTGNRCFASIRDLAKSNRPEIVTFGGPDHPSSHIVLEEFTFEPDTVRSRFQLRIGRDRPLFRSKIVSPEVALLLGPAVHFALECGITLPQIVERTEAMVASPGRETLTWIGNGVVIDDTYNANPLSMKKAIHLLDGFRQKGYETWAVLGDMLELGDASDRAHQELIRFLLKLRIDQVILLGAVFHRAADQVLSGDAAGQGVFLVSSHAEGTAIFREKLAISPRKWVILFKGSRAMEMERAIPMEWRSP
ncbi:MAG TPA: UDP-N-acetylmuramoyl-tripeptide--D-alanyl-D-alanine ligase [Atribacteraceae bacterium]|nr:UDP-N-acetylmuramoyl-tripeptide--D-alanyl-D-alanine ligase [Atribacteraceae bacterium]